MISIQDNSSISWTMFELIETLNQEELIVDTWQLGWNIANLDQ